MDALRLFVDDIRPAPAGWHLARSVTEAVRILATAPARIVTVSVDHDIAHVEMADDGTEHRYACAETFEPVVRYIAIMPPGQRPDEVIIHTANVARAEALEALLKGTGIKVTRSLANCRGGGRSTSPTRFMRLVKAVGDLVIDARLACWHGEKAKAGDLLSEAESILATLAQLQVALPATITSADVVAGLGKVLSGVREARSLCLGSDLEKAAHALNAVHNIPLQIGRKVRGDECG